MECTGHWRTGTGPQYTEGRLRNNIHWVNVTSSRKPTEGICRKTKIEMGVVGEGNLGDGMGVEDGRGRVLMMTIDRRSKLKHIYMS